MWHVRETAQRWSESVLHTHDTPDRTAAAFGLGVAIGFSPFLGFHLVTGLALAFLLNLNRVAVIGGVCVNLPWLMGPYYAATTVFGTWLLRTPVPAHLITELHEAWDLPIWADKISAIGDALEPLLWPFTLGSLICAMVLGLVAYRLTLPIFAARYRHRTAAKHEVEIPK